MLSLIYSYFNQQSFSITYADEQSCRDDGAMQSQAYQPLPMGAELPALVGEVAEPGGCQPYKP